MNWKNITDFNTLKKAKEESYEKPVLIYKHSTRCNISGVVRNSLESDWDKEEMENVSAYYVDIIRHRDISNAIEESFGVRHESPQLLLLSNGECIFNTSHMGITYKRLKSKLNELAV